MDESIQKQLEAPTTLKPSAAMRLGCARTKPGRHYYFCDGAACAIGAMSLAMGWLPGTDIKSFETGALGEKLATEVIALNDGGAATREEIADWLESIGY